MTYLIVFLLLHPALLVLFWMWARHESKVIALPALVIDVMLNYTTASVLWGWPRRGEWTISKRLSRRASKWERRLADLLNRIKPGHI